MPHRTVTARIALAAACLLPALAAPPALAADQLVGAPRAPRVAPAPDRIIVVWSASASAPERADGRADADTTLLRTLGATRFQLVQPQPGQTVSDALDALRADPAVRSVQRDGFNAPQAVPNDPLLGQLWGLQNVGLGVDGFLGAVAGDDIHVLSAWERTVGSPSTVVADIDTGYRFNHEDLGPVAWTNPGEIPGNGVDDDGDGIRDDVHGADFVGPDADALSPPTDGDPTDDDLIDGGHGVHTAGTIGAAGNNGVGITGVAQNVRIMPLRVCAHSASGNGVSCPFSSEVAAINYAGAHGARVANMSLGGPDPAPVLRDAMAANPQTLFVISAGNGGSDGIGDDNDLTPTYPCVYDPSTSGIPGAIDNVVCVAATDQADGRASFSNYGATTVDLGAPGTETLSTFPTSSYFSDDFQAGDFATRWTATSGAGFRLSSESPLTSLGITDSPGGAPPASTTVASTSPSFSVPAGAGDCTLTGSRTFSLGGGSLTTTIVRNGSDWELFSPRASSGSGGFTALGISGVAGANVQIRFSYTSGGSPTAGDGVWLDNVDFSCINPVSATTGYQFLQGTSMAAPHVTGAAALLFSLKPSATVAEVKSALLSGVDPDPALAGITTTGGRLDVAAALNALVPLPPPPTTTPATPPVVNPPRTLHCVVPRLKGFSLARAKAALRAAHCALGKVTKPRARRGHRLPALVVTSSSPRAGAVRAAGAKVKLTLAPKPKRRRHR